MPLRRDFDAPGLRRLARHSKDANQARRLLALATIQAGGTRTQAVAADAHGVLPMDQAGWHTSDKLDLPANISIVLLPPKWPKLNPTENTCQFRRENWLSNRVFKSADDILDHCCDAWNNLADQPWRIMSIGLRD